MAWGQTGCEAMLDGDLCEKWGIWGKIKETQVESQWFLSQVFDPPCRSKVASGRLVS
jgi:hypothetical protein